jgi:hypothetical protein
MGQHSPLLVCPLPVFVHCWPEGHAPQAAPFAPHEELDSLEYASHDPPVAQHPLQEVEPHEQAPLEQVSPVAHAVQAAPDVPHSLEDCEE